MIGMRRRLVTAALMLGALGLSAVSSHAQSSTTVVGPAAINKALSTAAISAKLPLAAPAVFNNAEKAAAMSAPAGDRGSSAGSANGNGGGVTIDRPQLDGTQAFGASTAPYTTARVAVGIFGAATSNLNTPVNSYPFRPTGKLFLQTPYGTAVCTASLIKKGVLLTAAHCVHQFGQGSAGWYKNWTFCPAKVDAGGGAYGCYNAGSPRIANSYFNGTDTCAQAGVVCNNDIALLNVEPKSGIYAGNVVGWYGYGWNGYSYKASTFLGNVTTVQIAQLGYPQAFDGGNQMQRTDAVGWYFASGNLKNTQIGSAQTGGSSGGPWIVNLGATPGIAAGASLGEAYGQAVVGVTSYGAAAVGYNRLGASFFGQNKEFPNATYGAYGAGNIGALMQAHCTATPSFC